MEAVQDSCSETVVAVQSDFTKETGGGATAVRAARAGELADRDRAAEVVASQQILYRNRRH